MFVIRTILLLFIFKYTASQSGGKSCTTPDDKNGQCVSLESCSPIVDFLNKSPKPFPPELSELLNKYVCSYEDKAINTKVCCPSEPIILSRFGADINNPPPPPNVLEHENIDLLDEDCGLIDISDRIRDGENAGLKEFPWMAVLAYQSDNGIIYKCGGSIINQNYILTAAHCLVNNIFPLRYVRVGEYSLLNETDCDIVHPDKCLRPPQDLTIEKAIVHPEYNRTSFVNDIALLRVAKIDYGLDIIPVCLPVYKDVANEDFTSGVVTGWGFTDPDGKNVIDILQKVELERRDMNLCLESYKIDPKIKLSHKQVCVGGIGTKDSCGGDSGGPYHVATHFNEDDRYVQHGIVSIGHRYCGTPGFPAVYTKVLYYTKWILDNLKP